ncbi:MAG TPA: nitroreductase family protein [Terracidiphilus sp.]|nr:nitroreductase family protein [Terracidiphilus sp.]
MKSHRREFLKKATMLGSGVVLFPEPRPSHAEQKEQKSEAPPDPLQNNTLKTIHSLRTIHGNFADKAIPEAALQAILEASVRAANASNNQSYSILVVKDRKRMDQICGYSGSCLLLYCADYNRIKAEAAKMGYPFDPSNMEFFVTASTNTVLAAQTAVIAAKSLGIDSLLTNGIHRGDMGRLWELLGLPEKHCFPIIALVLGYPTTEPAVLKGRLTGTGVIHRDNYHRLTDAETAELIQQYDQPDLHLALVKDWPARGYKHYLDWYFKEWSGRATEEQSQIFRVLKLAGFVESTKATASPNG